MGKLFLTSGTLLLSSPFMLPQPCTRSTASDASLYPDTRAQAAQQPRQIDATNFRSGSSDNRGLSFRRNRYVCVDR
jgi:hypothetical protein